MAANGDTGNKATLAIAGSTGYTPAIKTITPGPATREALEDTVLSTTGGAKTFIADDLVDWGDFEIEYYYDQSAADFHQIDAAAATHTITAPIKSTENTAGTIAGTAFCIDFQPGAMVNGELMMGRSVFKWDGKTPPVFTAGST